MTGSVLRSASVGRSGLGRRSEVDPAPDGESVARLVPVGHRRAQAAISRPLAVRSRSWARHARSAHALSSRHGMAEFSS